LAYAARIEKQPAMTSQSRPPRIAPEDTAASKKGVVTIIGKSPFISRY